MSATPSSTATNIVLVHGGFVDGSGWEAVYRSLRRDGFTVSIVQNPTISLAEDVQATRRVVAAQNGPRARARTISNGGCSRDPASSDSRAFWSWPSEGSSHTPALRLDALPDKRLKLTARRLA